MVNSSASQKNSILIHSIFCMKEVGPVSIAGDRGLVNHYGSLSAGLSLALIQNRFFCFSQDYETFQAHACQSGAHHFMNGGLLQLAETTTIIPPS